MKILRPPVACALALAAGAIVQRTHALDVVFDYRFDSGGMFNDPARREALEAAAAQYRGFADRLSAIEPGGGNGWSLTITRPDTFFTSATVYDLRVPADGIVVFVAGFATHPSALGWAAGDSDRTVTGDDAWKQTVAARGQAGALLSTPTDFGPWGGTITFNSNVDWHFDPTLLPPNDRADFLTTVTHELGHILGYGQAESWFARATNSSGDGLLFDGDAAAALYGGPIPLASGASHWAEGTMGRAGGVLQETLMDPSTPRGQRELMTDLDYAGFADIGWQGVPEPGSAALVLLFVGLSACRRGGRVRRI